MINKLVRSHLLLQSYCGVFSYKERYCNMTREMMGGGLAEFQVERCDFSCCQTDMCNTGARGEPPSAEGTFTTASFVITAMSFLVLLSGILQH